MLNIRTEGRRKNTTKVAANFTSDYWQKGKAKKLALIAVANKLVKQVFAIVKNKSKYVENFA